MEIFLLLHYLFRIKVAIGSSLLKTAIVKEREGRWQAQEM